MMNIFHPMFKNPVGLKIFDLNYRTHLNVANGFDSEHFKNSMFKIYLQLNSYLPIEKTQISQKRDSSGFSFP